MAKRARNGMAVDQKRDYIPQGSFESKGREAEKLSPVFPDLFPNIYVVLDNSIVIDDNTAGIIVP